MKITHKIPVTALCLCTLLFAACTKRVDTSTVGRLTADTWKLTDLATDDNDNGAIDNNEIKPVASGDVETFLFAKNGTGVQTVKGSDNEVDYNFTWSLSADNNYLKRTMQGGDTLTSRIIDISDNTLILQNNTTPVISWYVMNH